MLSAPRVVEYQDDDSYEADLRSYNAQFAEASAEELLALLREKKDEVAGDIASYGRQFTPTLAQVLTASKRGETLFLLMANPHLDSESASAALLVSCELFTPVRLPGALSIFFRRGDLHLSRHAQLRMKGALRNRYSDTEEAALWGSIFEDLDFAAQASNKSPEAYSKVLLQRYFQREVDLKKLPIVNGSDLVPWSDDWGACRLAEHPQATSAYILSLLNARETHPLIEQIARGRKFPRLLTPETLLHEPALRQRLRTHLSTSATVATAFAFYPEAGDFEETVRALLTLAPEQIATAFSRKPDERNTREGRSGEAIDSDLISLLSPDTRVLLLSHPDSEVRMRIISTFGPPENNAATTARPRLSR